MPAAFYDGRENVRNILKGHAAVHSVYGLTETESPPWQEDKFPAGPSEHFINKTSALVLAYMYNFFPKFVQICLSVFFKIH